MKDFLKYIAPIMLAYMAGLAFKDIGYWNQLIWLGAVLMQLAWHSRHYRI